MAGRTTRFARGGPREGGGCSRIARALCTRWACSTLNPNAAIAGALGDAGSLWCGVRVRYDALHYEPGDGVRIRPPLVWLTLRGLALAIRKARPQGAVMLFGCVCVEA